MAWRNYITTHPKYWDVAYDGGTMPADPNYFRSWGGQYGHIDPGMPLDAADCPSGMSACTWGDWLAYRYGQTAALSGAYGVMLSDFTDSEPRSMLNTHDFNPRILAAYAASPNSAGQPIYPNGVPGATTQAKASYLVTNDFNRWVDFVGGTYAKYYGALASRLGAAAGRTGLTIDQCGGPAGNRRLFGTDARIIASSIPAGQYICEFDDQTIQVGRGGPLQQPPAQELAGAVVAAAREPLIRNGANLEADDSNYWSAIASFYPTLSAADRTEVGYKLLKRIWTWQAWAHIADRSGDVRRALAFVSRDYWDAGTLTNVALGQLQSSIQSVVPAKPFGPAIYYSVAIERATQQTAAASAGAQLYGPYLTYMQPPTLQAFLDSGSAAGYYVSDAALAKISKGSANAPSAWVVLEPGALLPASENASLSAIAPVVTSAAALAALPNQPLTFAKGMTGFGFFDQTNRLIVVASNPSTAPGASSSTGAIGMSGTGFSNGWHKWVNLLTGATGSVLFTNGAASMTQTLSRWDTQVYAFAP